MRRLTACRDIVDTEPSTGDVWKMLLGAINPRFDDDDEEDDDEMDHRPATRA